MALAGGLVFSQDTTTDGVPEPVDESSLILFPQDDAVAQAEEDAPPQDSPAPSSVGVGDLVRVLFVLAAVVGVIYLLVYFLKRFPPWRKTRRNRSASWRPGTSKRTVRSI